MLTNTNHALKTADESGELTIKVLHDADAVAGGYLVQMQQTKTDSNGNSEVLGLLNIKHEDIADAILFLRDAALSMSQLLAKHQESRKEVFSKLHEAQLAYGQFPKLTLAPDFSCYSFEGEYSSTYGSVKPTLDGFADVCLSRAVEPTESIRVPFTVQAIHDAIIMLSEGRVKDGQITPKSSGDEY